MTSPATHHETVAYLSGHDYFGLPSADVHIFCQGTMPAVDATKKAGGCDIDATFESAARICNEASERGWSRAS